MARKKLFQNGIAEAAGSWWVDENGNTWPMMMVTRRQAERKTKTLSNCHNCANCENCVDCECCISCKDCKGCSCCTDCLGVEGKCGEKNLRG